MIATGGILISGTSLYRKTRVPPLLIPNAIVLIGNSMLYGRRRSLSRLTGVDAYDNRCREPSALDRLRRHQITEV
jgi:hypothetical protein